VLPGAESAPGRTFVQIAGSGFRIPADILEAQFERSGQLQDHIYRYMQGFLVRTAQTAACNRLHNGLLHRAGLIDHARGVVTIRDRAGLEGTACECYRIVRDEFLKLSLLD